MIELFDSIPESVRMRDQFFVNLAFQCGTLLEAAKMIAEYRNSCIDEEEKDYVDFCFSVKLKQLTNEDQAFKA